MLENHAALTYVETQRTSNVLGAVVNSTVGVLMSNKILLAI